MPTTRPRQILRVLGSSRAGVILMVILAVLCGWGTFIERDFGTTAAGQLLYRSVWFMALEFLLALNVLFALLARFPWKKRQIPFLAAHFGVLLLLAGCYLTHKSAIEGEMAVFEGTACQEAVRTNAWSLNAVVTANDAAADEKIIRIPFSGGVFGSEMYSRAGWNRYVLSPALERLGGPGAVKKLARTALRGHYEAVRLAACLCGKGKNRLLYDKNGIRIEQIGYLCPGQFPEDPKADPIEAPFDKERANEFYALVKLRVEVDGQNAEFWLRTIPTQMKESRVRLDSLVHTVPGKDRSVRLALENAVFDPGFSIHLHDFRAEYEPGSTTPSSFSSRIDCVPGGGNGEGQKNILVRMNRPARIRSGKGSRSYWVYQSSFRGPFYPGSREFESIVGGHLLPGESTPRTQIEQSVLSLNSDPGRPLKNVGSILLVFGSLLLIVQLQKRCSSALPVQVKQVKSPKPFAAAAALCACIFLSAAALAALRVGCFDSASQKSWKPWRTLPVWSGGRVMPLETFARMTVREICGTDTPMLAVDQRILEQLGDGRFSRLPKLDQLLEQEKPTEEEEEKIRVWHADESAKERQNAERIASRIKAIFPEGKPRSFRAHELIFAWIAEPDVWRYLPILATDRAASESIVPDAGGRALLAPVEVEQSSEQARRIDAIQRGGSVSYADKTEASRQGALDRAAASLERNLSLWRAIAFHSEGEASMMAGFFLSQLLEPEGQQEYSTLEQLETSARRLRALAKSRQLPTPFDDPDFELNQTVTIGKKPNTMEVLRLLERINLLRRVYPESPYSMNSRLFASILTDIKATRDTLTSHLQGVITPQETTSADDSDHTDYVSALMKTNRLLETVDRQMTRAASALTTLGSYRVTLLSDRKRLEPPAEGVSAVVAQQAATLGIDEVGSLDLFPYDQPFADRRGLSPWCSIQTLLAAESSSLTEEFFGSRSEEARQLAGQLRAALSQGFSPEAGSAAQGVCASLSCLETSAQARRLTAEYLYDRLDPFRGLWFFAALATVFILACAAAGLFRAKGNSSLIARSMLTAAGTCFLILSMLSTAAGELLRAYITGWAPLASMFETIVLLAFLTTIVTLCYALYPMTRPEGKVRRGAVLLGAVVALAVGLLAYYNRGEFNPAIRPIAAVLRSNFWLAVHVSAIMASYAFGVLAWGVALAITFRLLFAKSASSGSAPVLIPLLALLRWTVLLLTLGTILGAYWADRSWGRFWSWDPKEVWALVTLLVYLVVLHRRTTDGEGFSPKTVSKTARGGILGAMAIIMTWYGLSFVFGAGGRHSYAAGEATRTMVMYILIAVNLFIAVLPTFKSRSRT